VQRAIGCHGAERPDLDGAKVEISDQGDHTARVAKADRLAAGRHDGYSPALPISLVSLARRIGLLR
jgi:hypothetical protein